MKVTFESLERRNLLASVADIDHQLVSEVCAMASYLVDQPQEAHDDFPQYDIDDSGRVNVDDLEALLATHETENGDFNLDGAFDSGDLVYLFQDVDTMIKYRDNTDGAIWRQGDANCDSRFDTSDFVYLLAQGNYEQPPFTEL